MVRWWRALWEGVNPALMEWAHSLKWHILFWFEAWGSSCTKIFTNTQTQPWMMNRGISNSKFPPWSLAYRLLLTMWHQWQKNNHGPWTLSDFLTHHVASHPHTSQWCHPPWCGIIKGDLPRVGTDGLAQPWGYSLPDCEINRPLFSRHYSGSWVVCLFVQITKNGLMQLHWLNEMILIMKKYTQALILLSFLGVSSKTPENSSIQIASPTSYIAWILFAYVYGICMHVYVCSHVYMYICTYVFFSHSLSYILR